jgi:Eukaryotic protein of unknown function (DUF866)
MPKFALEVKAQFTGVSSVSVPEKVAPDFPWHVHLRCGSCGEESEKPVIVAASDQVEGIRGATVSIKISCKLCARVNDLTILPGKSEYTAADSPGWKPFLFIEARGTEPTKVEFPDNVYLSIKGDEGFEAEEALIDGSEFYGFDEKLATEMEVTDWEMRVVKAAK